MSTYKWFLLMQYDYVTPCLNQVEKEVSQEENEVFQREEGSKRGLILTPLACYVP